MKAAEDIIRFRSDLRDRVKEAGTALDELRQKLDNKIYDAIEVAHNPPVNQRELQKLIDTFSEQWDTRKDDISSTLEAARMKLGCHNPANS